MTYLLFLGLAILYNFHKFRKDRAALISSIKEAHSRAHREMILSHHFYVLIFEVYFSLIVAHLLSEKVLTVGILGLGLSYLILFFLGFFFYQFFVQYLEKQTQLDLKVSFKQNLFKELRVNFALVLLPILIYSVLNWTFQGSVYEEWGSLWFIGILFNLIFVSVITIVCTVIIMLRLIPNREITEPEYTEIINKRLAQIGMEGMRVRWIETDIKNAFVVGLRLVRFSNQTMFVGRRLRNLLTLEEFDSVICHELAHVANRHIHKRVIDLIKNFLSILVGATFLMLITAVLFFLYHGEDFDLHHRSLAFISMSSIVAWILINQSLLYDTIRSHEFEADAYAVLNLGASFESMKSALEKLTAPEEMPEYLKQKTSNKQKSAPMLWLGKIFSTHPDLDTRIQSLQSKLAKGLPFNHYISPVQKFRSSIGHFFQWRVAIPLTLILVFSASWSVLKLHDGRNKVIFISKASPDSILKDQFLKEHINEKPYLLGQSYMYYIVKKKNPELIDHFLSMGASKGRTLIYLSQLKEMDLFKSYYSRYESEISNDEYFLILRMTARVDFVEGYRYLVNSDRFEGLDLEYKKTVTGLYKTRAPASIKSK